MGENDREYYSQESLKFNYNREERYRMAGIHPKKTGAASSRQGRIILFIDIIFILIIGTVIYPLIIKKQNSLKMEHHIISVSKSVSEDKKDLNLEITVKPLPDEIRKTGVQFIEIAILDSSGQTVESWYEPLKKEKSVFRGILPVPEDRKLVMAVRIGEEKKNLTLIQPVKKYNFFRMKKD